jgi:hypothetical protein
MTSLPVTEADFLRSVLDLAHLCGWESWHPRPARTLDSWRTAGTGSMAKGFPDLVLAHADQRRVLFIELKTDTGRLTSHQERVLDLLARVAADRNGVEVYTFRPRDWESLEAVLR